MHDASDAWLCPPAPPAGSHASTQPLPKHRHVEGHAPDARDALDHTHDCQPSQHLKGQRDCDVFLAIPGLGSASDRASSQHRADCLCNDCAAQPHPCRRTSLNSPLALASVAESDPMLIAACAGNSCSRPACYPRPGACYSSSGSSSGEEECAGGSHSSLSRGSSWGNMAGSSEEWSAEAVALQAACDEALRACSASQTATPPCGAAQSPVRIAVLQQQQQQLAAKGLASPLGGFFRGLLGRTRSAPMADAFSADVSAPSSSDKTPHHSSGAHAQPSSSLPNTAPRQQVLTSASSLPDCGSQGTAATDRVSTWGLASLPAPDSEHRQQQRRQQQRREQQQSPFCSHSMGTRSSAPVMVAVEPLPPPAATRLLAVSEQLPRRMVRACWCLADFAVVRKMYKGVASSVYHVSACPVTVLVLLARLWSCCCM